MASVHCDLHDVVSKRSVRGTVCVLSLLLIFASAVEQSIAANIGEAYCGFRAAANLFAVVKVTVRGVCGEHTPRSMLTI